MCERAVLFSPSGQSIVLKDTAGCSKRVWGFLNQFITTLPYVLAELSTSLLSSPPPTFFSFSYKISLSPWFKEKAESHSSVI